jgi:hypothetical protein
MSSPSLVLVPARYKATKLYTQYPTDGSADFIVSQASGNSTRVNASGFVEAVSANIPRIDYRNVAQSIDCPALLIEASAQNIAQRSNELNTVPNIVDFTTFSGNIFISPDGTQNAARFTETTANDRHGFYQYQTIASGANTVSIFTKETGRRYIAFTSDFTGTGTASYFDLQTKSVVTNGSGHIGSVQDYGNGWLRLIVTIGASVSGSRYVTWGGSPSGTTSSYVGNVNISQTFYGLQIETGSVATSYIPTTTAALTRGADIIYASGAVSGTIGQTSGTIYAEVDMRNWSASGRVVAISNGTQDGCIVIHVNADRSFTVFTNASSFNQLTMQTVSGLYNGLHRVAFAYKKDDFAFYLNGALVSSHTSGTVPATSQLYVGKIETSGSTNFLNDRVRSVALFKTRLSNSDLSILTGIDYTDLTWNTYTTRASLSTELPTCLLTRYFELINV